MKLALALVVFSASIAVFFADEWMRLFKRIVAIPGVRLLIPLIFVSWLIEAYQNWGYWLLLWLQAKAHGFERHVMLLFPFEFGALHLTRIIYLCIVACLPAWAFWLLAKYKKQDVSLLQGYRLGVALWIVAVVLILIDIGAN